jgi:hypothetical protein
MVVVLLVLVIIPFFFRFYLYTGANEHNGQQTGSDSGFLCSVHLIHNSKIAKSIPNPKLCNHPAGKLLPLKVIYRIRWKSPFIVCSLSRKVYVII